MLTNLTLSVSVNASRFVPQVTAVTKSCGVVCKELRQDDIVERNIDLPFLCLV
jgi:hypothetical protein